MKTIDWIGAGIGSLFSSGFLSYLGSVSSRAIASGVNFGVLVPVLAALGVVFVGYGVVKDFVISRIEKAQATDTQ